MSKTYRDMVRGRYRAADIKFDNDDKYHEIVWCKSYRYDPHAEYGNDLTKIVWYQRRKVKTEYADKDPWDLLSYKEQGCVFRGYSRNPSWWNNLYGTRPNRVYTRNQLRKYKGNRIPDYDIEDSFYGNKIHCDYYW